MLPEELAKQLNTCFQHATFHRHWPLLLKKCEHLTQDSKAGATGLKALSPALEDSS